MPEVDVPQVLQDLYEKAKEALDRNNYDYAQTLLTSALKSNPSFQKARSLLRITQRKKAEAVRTPWSKKIFGLVPLPLFYFQAYLYLLKDQWLKAIPLLEKILKIDPTNSFALQKLAYCALQLEWRQTAVDTFEVLRKISPADVRVRTSLGQLYLKEGMLEKSRKYFEEAIRISPADPAALKGLKDLAAMSTIERGGWTDTTSYREKIQNEAQAEIFEREARTIKTGEDLTLLIENLVRKLQTQTENPALLRELAQLYTQNHQYDEALVTYEKLGQLLPFDEHLQKEISDLKEQKIHQEILEVKKELAIHPNHPDLNSKLQDLEHKKKEAVLTECKMRVERYPNNLAYRYEIGCLYYDLGKFNEAIQELQSAVKDAQRRTQALYYLGLCFKESGFYDLAEKQLLKVVDELQDMDHFKKEAIYQLGLVYEATEQFQKAVAEYKKIFEVDIGFKDISQKIQKAYKK